MSVYNVFLSVTITSSTNVVTITVSPQNSNSDSIVFSNLSGSIYTNSPPTSDMLFAYDIMMQFNTITLNFDNFQYPGGTACCLQPESMYSSQYDCCNSQCL